jgi:hypothetical protein
MTAAYLPDEDDQPSNVRELATVEERVLPGHRTRATLSDGSSFVVRITNRERLAWDRTAPRKKWGTVQEVPFLASTFMAYCAAKREGLTALTFDQFSDVCEDLEDLEEDESDVARPTRKGPGDA